MKSCALSSPWDSESFEVYKWDSYLWRNLCSAVQEIKLLSLQCAPEHLGFQQRREVWEVFFRIFSPS